jgi:Peptidase MA superfamily
MIKRAVSGSLILCLLMSAQGLAGIRIVADLHGDSAYADSVVHITSERLTKLIGSFEIDTLTIFIVANGRRFDSLTQNSLPDWGAGVAIPFQKQIVVKSPLILPGDKALGELIAHEFTHIALATEVDYRPVPRWLNEGMAMYFSAEWSWQDHVAMGTEVVLGKIISLSEIEYLNRFSGRKAEIAYSESFLAFKYFLDTYGQSGLRIFLDNIAAGRSLDEAMVAASGGDYDAFEKEFAGYLSGRYNLVVVLFNSEIFWLALAVLFVVGFFLARWRRKKRMREMEQYDKLHSTDFDYGNIEEPDEDKPWD